MTDAEILLGSTFGRCLDRFSFIYSFRATSQKGMTAAVPIIHEQKRTFINTVVSVLELAKMIERKEDLLTDPLEETAAMLTNTTLKNSLIATNAASLVFAHSIIDGAALDFCRVTALVAPRDWESSIDQRQIKLSEARESDYEQLLRRKLAEFFQQLDREPLVKKADHLFARCTPPEKWRPIEDYEYDRDRLKRLDQYRHDVVHGGGLQKEISAIDDEIAFLQKTCIFFTMLVVAKYQIKFHPDETMKAVVRSFLY